jgi:acetyltransferase-like isoleucine patch superfamily enzyme
MSDDGVAAPPDGSRTLPWDWYPGTIPANVELAEGAYVETTFSFHCYRSTAPVGVRIARGASTYLGTMFDVGPHGRVSLGEYALVHGARIICDESVEIGDYALISWNVVLMDTYRVPFDVAGRREALERAARGDVRVLDGAVSARPIRIGANVWIGFEACVMPGVSIGEGAVVGARSVVTEDVAPHTIVAGNPARFIRNLQLGEAGN